MAKKHVPHSDRMSVTVFVTFSPFSRQAQIITALALTFAIFPAQNSPPLYWSKKERHGLVSSWYPLRWGDFIVKVSRFAIGISAAAILILAGLGVEFLWSFGRGQRDLHMPVPEEFAQQITVHEDGDFVYSYSLDDVAIDQEERVLYVPNLVNVFTEHTFSRAEKEMLAEKVGGTVVSDLCGGINFFQLHVNVEDYSELEEIAQSLRETNGIMDASYEVPLLLEPDEPDGNPWSISGEEPDRGKESSPAGNDWWAEAIGAYTAWDYESWFHDVAVGVIDSGFYTQHEDLGGNTTITMLPGYPQNSFHYHGTAVAGIIGAADNEIGLRGVASSQYHQLTMYCVDWNPVTNDAESEDYVTLLGTATFSKQMKEMLKYHVKVINNSWGMADISYNSLITEELKEFFKNGDKVSLSEQDIQAAADALAQLAYDTSRTAVNITLQMIASGEEFLIVQSAGNGVNNGGYPSQVEQTGFFRGITRELFEQMYPSGYLGINYTELNYHILVVGAVANRRTDDGAYIMTSVSNYGPEVDLCAPGLGIFTTYDSTYENPPFTDEEDKYHPTDKYFESFSGTSAAAPMVTGSAALLWSIDPDLTAQEVWGLLVYQREDLAEGTKAHGDLAHGSEGVYPMLNIGAAVRALMEEKNEALVSEIRITDQATGEPVEGAEVIYSTGLFEGGKTATTDSEGRCTIRGAANLRPYPAATTVLVKAEGQLRWCGTVRAWLEDDPDQTINEIELDLNNILDITGDLLEQLKQDLPALWNYIQTVMDEVKAAQPDFADTLAQLAGQYGVISLGEEVYPKVTGYGGGEELVDPARLNGLLGADIFDYDGDGQEELLTVRLETGAPDNSDWSETFCSLAVYEWDAAAGQAVLSDERQVDMGYLTFTNNLHMCALHLFRGTFQDGTSAVYFSYHQELNSRVFGTLRVSYDGTLQITGGVECDEGYAWLNCSQLGSDGNTWESQFSYQDPDDIGVSQEKADTCRSCYLESMEQIGLVEHGIRGVWMNPDRPTQGGAPLRLMVDRESVACLPAERSSAVDGTLTTLCGLWALPSSSLLNEDMTLSVYDEGDLLTPWR